MTGPTQPSHQVMRTFLGWDAPALPRAAALLADHYQDAAAGELDLRGAVVVTPGGRSGRRLIELLLDEAEARGLTLTPPRVVTTGGLPELLYTPSTGLADPTTVRHAFSQALQALSADRLHPAFPNPPQPQDAVGWMTLAGVVAPLHRNIAAEGLTFGDVVRTLREGFPYDDTARWEVLSAVEVEYLRLLKRAGFADPDRARGEALDRGVLDSPGDLWLIGIVELPGLVRSMLRQAAAPSGSPIHALVHAPEENADFFDELGCVIPELWESAHIPLDDARIHVVRRPPDQADAVADILRGLDGRFSAEEIVVGAPDRDVVPYLERGLAMAGVPHRDAAGTALAATGPYRLLEAVGAFLDGRRFVDFASLVRHPDVSEALAAQGRALEATSGSKSPLDAIDRYYGEHLPAKVAGSLSKGRGYDDMQAVVSGLEDTLELDKLKGLRALSEWMPPVLELLGRVYGLEPLSLGKQRERHTVEVCAALKGAAGVLGGLPPALDSKVNGAEAIRLLLSELRSTNLPPDPERDAVELLGWLELPWDDAPTVIVTGANDRHLPDTFGADAYLPGALRCQLGLPDDRARFARDAYLLSALIHSREELHVVAGRLNAAGDPLRLSRLLFATSDEEAARRIHEHLGDEEAPPPGIAELTGATQSRFQSPPEPTIAIRASPGPSGSGEPVESLSVTEFGKLLSDPYRYALERLLGLRTVEDIEAEMSPPVFGSLAHTVLERFGRSEAKNSPDEEVITKALDELLNQATASQFGRTAIPAVKVQIEQLRARLHAFAGWQAGWITQGWRVVCVEASIAREDGVRFEVDGQPILLRGKIDRIDHNVGTDEWAIWDYKTSDGAKTPEAAHRKGRTNDRRWIDLQLPLYRHLLAGVLADDGAQLVPPNTRDRVSLGYILLPKDLTKVGDSIAKWDEEALESADEAARTAVRTLRTGEFRFDPGVRGYPDDQFDALLGWKELPVADNDGEDADGDTGGTS